MILMHSKKTATVIIIIIITNRRNEFISRTATRKKSSQSSTASTTFSLYPFVFSFFCLVFFFVPACQSNGVETDRLILELSLEAELQHGSNIQGKKTHMGKNENKKGRENET